LQRNYLEESSTRDESRDPERKPNGPPHGEASRPEGLHRTKGGSKATGQEDTSDAYALALKAIEQLFLEQNAQIAKELEEARAAAERSDFADHGSISHAAVRAARISWEADEQMARIKQRLDELYQERVVEPIMEVRLLSATMEERNSKCFRRRVGDAPR
jgi:hypothetical protein